MEANNLTKYAVNPSGKLVYAGHGRDYEITALGQYGFWHIPIDEVKRQYGNLQKHFKL